MQVDWIPIIAALVLSTSFILLVYFKLYRPNRKRKDVKEYRIYIEPEDDDQYHGYVTNLRGIHTMGNTVEETMLNVGQAITAYMTSVIKHGDKI